MFREKKIEKQVLEQASFKDNFIQRILVDNKNQMEHFLKHYYSY